MPVETGVFVKPLEVLPGIDPVGTELETGEGPAMRPAERNAVADVGFGFVEICFQAIAYRSVAIKCITNAHVQPGEERSIGGVESDLFIFFITIVVEEDLRLKGIEDVLAYEGEGIIRVGDIGTR